MEFAAVLQGKVYISIYWNEQGRKKEDKTTEEQFEVTF